MNRPLLFAWLISIIATLGSLFFSEVLHFIPCTLCWYQRILMYPLTILIGIAFYNNNFNIYKYIIPFSGLGMFFSLYHYGLQKLPSLQKFEICTRDLSCSGQHINLFGFITIPFLAFVAFALVTFAMILLRKQYISLTSSRNINKVY